MLLEKTLGSPTDCREIKPVNPKGNQSWIFIGRTDAEAETPILWPHDAKNWLIGKDPDAGKDWKQEKGTTEEEMVGWHHWLNGHEFEQALGVSWWRTGKPIVLQSMGSRQVGHDWVTSLSPFTFMRWRRKWQPTPVFLPGESQGRGSLVGCRLWGHTESATAEAT